MSKVYLMFTISPRERLPKFIETFKSQQLETSEISLAAGTANSATLSRLGLEDTEKAVTFTIVTGETWTKLRKVFVRDLHMDAPGAGVAWVVPISSFGGPRELTYMIDGQDFEMGEESAMTGTDKELLIVILNQGYSEMVMDAARGAGAGGGTIIHARGTGVQKAEKFLGITLATEKQMIFVVTSTAKKKQIMTAIMEQAGPDTKAGAITFALPVDDVAGIHFYDEEDE